MQVLTEGVFNGKWRSFKSFKNNGDIRIHSDHKYRQFEFGPGRMLTIKTFGPTSEQKLVHTDAWSIILKDRKHYLMVLKPNLSYEVLTINHTVMVLFDIASGEKIFFAKNNSWKEYLISNRDVIL